MNDPFNLQRFLDAQSEKYETALAELTAGHEYSHWIWYVFPQIAGLRDNDMALRYAITGLKEAQAYLAHPILGERLKECCQLLLQLEGLTAYDIFDGPDDMKLRSSMTLFSAVEGGHTTFNEVLEKYFQGKVDARTLEILERQKQ